MFVNRGISSFPPSISACDTSLLRPSLWALNFDKSPCETRFCHTNSLKSKQNIRSFPIQKPTKFLTLISSYHIFIGANFNSSYPLVIYRFVKFSRKVNRLNKWLVILFCYFHFSTSPRRSQLFGSFFRFLFRIQTILLLSNRR